MFLPSVNMGFEFPVLVEDHPVSSNTSVCAVCLSTLPLRFQSSCSNPLLSPIILAAASRSVTPAYKPQSLLTPPTKSSLHTFHHVSAQPTASFPSQRAYFLFIPHSRSWPSCEDSAYNTHPSCISLISLSLAHV